MKEFLSIAAAVACALGACAQQWAQVNIPAANIRTKAGNSQELSSQELMGMPVKVHDLENGWWQGEFADGYTGFIRDESLVLKTDEEMAAWRKSPRLVVSSLEQITCYDSPGACDPRHRVTDLVPNSIVLGSLENPSNGRVEVTLPDGRKAWAPACAFTTIEDWANQPYNADKILEQAYALIGTPYLWGGTSTKALDCSGLSKTCHLKNGIFLRRDASMQARTGQQLGKPDWRELQKGDLLFFGNRNTGRVTHVAVYDGESIFVHSTGAGDRVRINSLDPEHPLYSSIYMTNCIRVNGSEDTDGIVKACHHPWLF